MKDSLRQPILGESLKAERQRRQLSLRDLADQIGVSFNTLSRVERGHLPDLKNYDRIVRWLDSPGETLFELPRAETPITHVIAKHLYTDSRLKPEDAGRILSVIQDMYDQLATPTPAFAVHLRSSQTFLPEVGSLLSQALHDMHERLSVEDR